MTYFVNYHITIAAFLIGIGFVATNLFTRNWDTLSGVEQVKYLMAMITLILGGVTLVFDVLP
jgi:TRAP-type C4-dicarboxylate transport system permease small subunit